MLGFGGLYFHFFLAFAGFIVVFGFYLFFKKELKVGGRVSGRT